MLPFLARRWFLLLLASGLALAILLPDWLRPATSRLPLRLVVALSLFLAAWSLEGQRLWRAFGRPVAIVWALLISFGLLPLASLLSGFLLPNVDLRLGILLITCVPCTLSSAVLWTRHAGGDEALALLVVVLTNALAWLVTPLWLTGAGPVAVVLDVPAMMRSLALVLVVPVCLGQGVRAIPGVAQVAERFRTLNSVVARLLVAAVLIAAAVDAADQAGHLSAGFVMRTGGACVGVHVTGLVLGLWVGRGLGIPREDRIAVGFAGSQKTLPVGLMLFGAHYREEFPLAVLPLLLYHAAQLLIDTTLADRLKGTTERRK